MKKYFSILLIFIVILTTVSCTKPTEEPQNKTNNSQQASVGLYLNPEYTLKSKIGDAEDIFVGKILSVKSLSSDVRFPDFIPDNGIGLNLYTVKIEKTYISHLISENTTITVVGTYKPEPDKYGYSNAFEVGNTYIMSGRVQPYENKPIITVFTNMSAEINKGKLIPITTSAEQMYAGIETIEQLENNADFIELCKSKDIFIPNTFYNEDEQLINDSTATLNPEKSKTKQEVIETIREAIKVDSKVKMDISYDNYPNDETK